jgi:hypothetical protein
MFSQDGGNPLRQKMFRMAVAFGTVTGLLSVVETAVLMDPRVASNHSEPQR